ncbi:MAG: DNA repair protein RecN [Candidatus Puniceispirillales bacterium]
MIKELIIKNIVLIKYLDIEFNKGLSVLTGETGTGKSILLDSLGLILGNRVDFNLIRKGENEASVTALFYVPDNHIVAQILNKYNINFENELLIRRNINSSGKSKCYINDILITRNALSEITDCLIELQGQFEDRGLLNIKTHLYLLDIFSNHNHLIETTKKSFNKLIELKKEIEDTKIREKVITDDNEWIEESLNQLELLDPKLGEEEKLNQTKLFLNNREKIFIATNQAKTIIDDELGIEDLINKIFKTFDNVKLIDRFNINQAINIVNKIKVDVEELKSIINNEVNEMSENNQNIEFVNDRLYELRSQARKHNCSVDDLANIKSKLKLKIDQIDNDKFMLEKLQKEYESLKNEFISNSNLLSNSRRKSAIILSRKINDELPHLKLENANFNVQFEAVQFENASEMGIDRVTFLASTNTGADALPINKIASGGELSRFLLAIKVVLETVVHKRTIIFDEIDSGIGGAVANAVGVRLAKLGDNYQTMVVTHSPQVTSKGHYHYLVQKNNINNNITTNVTQLNEKEKIEEIARMVSGSIITNEAREAASKLLDT